jgi:lysyl-tRNA synthetase, class II
MAVEDIKNAGLDKLAYLEGRGINPYPGEPPLRTHHNAEITAGCDELIDQEVSVVGRLTAVRGHGKLAFIDITDGTGRMQAMIASKPDEVDGNLELFKNGFGLGDFVRVGGTVMKTRTGEPTIRVGENGLGMLAKAILPPPFAQEGGIKDPEIRYRQRYLDLMANPEVRERFEFRSKMVEYMRKRFIENGCMEVQTPILDNTYGGASARPFITHHNALGEDLFLRISDELYLKRLLVGGFEGVFEFSTDFRNEGMDKTHNPEFTQVELYKAYVDYEWMMKMTENLFSDISRDLLGKETVEHMGNAIDLKAPWRRLSVYDGLREHYGFDPETASEAKVREAGAREGIEDADTMDLGYLLLELFDKKVAPTLINPTFVIDYPESTSPLTKKHRSKSGLVERFELYVNGMELANCYTELNDPRKQRENFEEQIKRRFAGDEEAMPMDEDFVIAMEYGMPPMGGIGISIDRWVMILTGAEHIREVILFPTMKRRQQDQV